VTAEPGITGREMLRDFWDHWVWETRIGEFEASTPPRTPNPELREQIAHYQKKYGEQSRTGLHRLSAIYQGAPSDGREDAEAEAGLALLIRHKHAGKLARLEALSPLMDEVLPVEPDRKPPTWATIPKATTAVGEGYDLQAVAAFFAGLSNIVRRRPEYESHAATLAALGPALREALKCLESPKRLVDSYTPDIIATLVRNLGPQ
jgi:hypothetical protein